MLLGRAFHKVTAATTNELSPAFTCSAQPLTRATLVLGTINNVSETGSSEAFILPT